MIANLSIQSSVLAESMTFSLEPDSEKRILKEHASLGPPVIYARGEITEGTTERFLTFVRQHELDIAQVNFDSPGGLLVEGMRLGRAIRELKFSTSVSAYSASWHERKIAVCASSCTYAFAGGVARYFDERTGKLGIHQFYSVESKDASEQDVQQVSGLIVAYLDQMGIDTKAFSVASLANRKDIVWLSLSEAEELRLVNNGKRPPVAEIRITATGMRPYLRIEQGQPFGATRVLFNCDNNQITLLYGLVTDVEYLKHIEGNQRRSYLELDGEEFLLRNGAQGTAVHQSALWIVRHLTSTEFVRVLKSEQIGGWVDGFGAMRYGGTLNLPTVRGKIAEYAKHCYGLD